MPSMVVCFFMRTFFRPEPLLEALEGFLTGVMGMKRLGVLPPTEAAGEMLILIARGRGKQGSKNGQWKREGLRTSSVAAGGTHNSRTIYIL